VKTPKLFVGRWRIVDTELWEPATLDEFGPAMIAIGPDRMGRLQMIAVEAEMDCRFHGDRLEFSWLGTDDGEPSNGRGWAQMTARGRLEGRIYFYQGDESAFVAERDARATPSVPQADGSR
jgi:hypothetical protein